MSNMMLLLDVPLYSTYIYDWTVPDSMEQFQQGTRTGVNLTTARTMIPHLTARIL